MKHIKTGLCQEVDNSFVSWLTKWSFAMFIEIFPLLLNVISPLAVGLQVFEYLCPIPKLHNSTSNRKILLLLLFSSTFTFDFCRNRPKIRTLAVWKKNSRIRTFEPQSSYSGVFSKFLSLDKSFSFSCANMSRTQRKLVK